MKKRYAITLEDETMQRLKIEAVKAGVTIGDWIASKLTDERWFVSTWADWPQDEEVTVDEPVKKAIEKDQVKADRGRLEKGLGEIPGVTRGPNFGTSRPAPKPKK